MIDWLGARKPIDLVLLMTTALVLIAAAIDRVGVPVMKGILHAIA
jgi:hypothetical protein